MDMKHFVSSNPQERGRKIQATDLLAACGGGIVNDMALRVAAREIAQQIGHIDLEAAVATVGRLANWGATNAARIAGAIA